MKKVLVTGAAGFIGSNLVDRLMRDGYDTVCLDINENGHWNKLANNYIGDISDSKLVNELMVGVDYVFHMAADVSIQDAIENPVHCYETNVSAMINVLEAAKNNQVKNFIFSSTSAIYKCKFMVQSEESEVLPTLNPYACSKYAGEDLCRMYSKLYGLHTTILRYFNVYGNRQHSTGNYAPVLGLFLKQKKQGLPLTITGTGKQRRDFIHVSDVVSANISSAEKNKISGELFNVGSGVSYSINEISKMISDNSSYIKERSGEVFATQAIIDKISNKLGWIPKVDLQTWIMELL
tara:strand:- start:1010 stop:1888 length:879 start_codon:yes stop_codon:yes gene_type:complete